MGEREPKAPAEPAVYNIGISEMYKSIKGCLASILRSSFTVDQWCFYFSPLFSLAYLCLRYRKLEISTALAKAKSREPAYSLY